MIPFEWQINVIELLKQHKSILVKAPPGSRNPEGKILSCDKFTELIRKKEEKKGHLSFYEVFECQ